MTGTGVDVLEEKEQLAGTIINEALSEKERLFALFSGDKASLVLLHMLQAAGGGRITVPVISFQFLPLPAEALRFVDKLRRMWSIDLDVARFSEQRGMEKYTEEEISKLIDGVLLKRGARRVISSRNLFSVERDRFVEFRPLDGFSEEDVAEYIRRHRLPTSSVDLDEKDGVMINTVSEQSTDPENKELADRLKKLGYL